MANPSYWADEVAQLSRLAFQLGTTFELGESISSDFTEVKGKLLTLGACLDRLLDASHRSTIVFDSSKGRDSLVKIIDACRKSLYRVESIVDKYSDKLDVDGRAWKKWFSKGWRKVDWTSKGGSLRELKTDLDRHCDVINLVVDTLTMSPDGDATPIIHELDSTVLAPTISASSIQPGVSSIPSTASRRRSSAQTPSKYFNPAIPDNYNIFEGYPRVFADIITDSKKIMKRTFQITYRNSTAAVCPEAMINPNLYSLQFQAQVEPLFICRCFSAGVLRTGIHSNFTQSIKCGPSTVIVHNENPRHIRPGHALKEYIFCQPALGENVNAYNYEKNPIVVRVPNNKVGHQTAFEGSIVQILAMKAARSLCENRMIENKWVRWEKDGVYKRENRGRVLVASSIRLHLDRDDALALRYLAPDTMRSWPHDLGIDMMTIVDYRSIEKSNLYSSNMTRDPNCWEDTESVMLHVDLEAAGHMAVKRSFHCEYLGKEPKITGSVITCDVASLIHFEDQKPVVGQLAFPEVLQTINISAGEKGMVWLDASNRPVPSLETAIMSQEASTFGSLLMQAGRWMLEFRATRCSRHEEIVLLSSLKSISIFGGSEASRHDFHESTLALLRDQVRNSSRLLVRGRSGNILSQNVTTEASGTTVDLNEKDDELAVSNSVAIFAFLRKDKDGETVFLEHETKPLVYHFKESEDAVTCIFKIADPGINEVLPEKKIREEAMANINIERRGSSQSQQALGLNGMSVFYSELPAITPPQNTVIAPSVELPAMPVLPEVNPTVVRNSLDSSRRASVAPETMYPAVDRAKKQSSPEDLVRSQSSPGHNIGSFAAPMMPMGLSLDGMPTSTSPLPPPSAPTPTPPSNYIPPPPTRIPPPKPSKPDFFGDLENLRRRLSPIKLEISFNEDASSVLCPCATVHPELVTPPGSIETATPQLLACNCDEQSAQNTGHLSDFRAGPFTLAILALGHHFAKRPGCYALVNVVAKTMMGQELYLHCQNPEDDHIIGDALGGFLRLRAARSVHLGLSTAEAVPISVEDGEKISLLSSFGNVEASPEVYFRKERSWDLLSKRARSLNMSQYISLKRANLSEQLSENLKGEYLHDGKPILRFNMDDMTEFAAVVESPPKWHAEYDSAIIYTVMMDVSSAIVSVSDEDHEKMGPGRLKFTYKGFYPKEKVAQRDAFQSLAWFDFWKSRTDISRLYELGNHEEQVFSTEIETLRADIENSAFFDGIFDESNTTIFQDQELNRLRVVTKEPKNNWILIQEVLLGTFPLDTNKTSRTAINHSAIGSRMFCLGQETVIADPVNEMSWRVAGGIQYTFRSTTDRDDFCESLAKATDYMESLEEEQLQTFVEDPHITETVELIDQTVLDNSMPSLLRRSTMPRIDIDETAVPLVPPVPSSQYTGSNTANKNAVLPRIAIPPPPPLPIPPSTLLSARSPLSRTNSDRFSTMSPISVVTPANTESSTGSIYRVTSRYVGKQPNELTCWPGEIVRTETEDPNDTEWVYGIKRGIASNTTRHTQTIVAGWVPRRCLQRDSQYIEATEDDDEINEA